MTMSETYRNQNDSETNEDYSGCPDAADGRLICECLSRSKNVHLNYLRCPLPQCSAMPRTVKVLAQKAQSK